MTRAASLMLLLLWAFCLDAGEGWRVVFPRGPRAPRLTINDLKFASAARGVAVGWLGEGRRRRPVEVLTGDGGKTWSTVKTAETGSSLFFVNERTGWMVTGEGLWKTADSGRSWTKLPRSAATEGLLRVCFLDEMRGWAVGVHKAVHETTDGGASWSRVRAAEEVEGNPEYTSYNWVTFVSGRFGMIAGASLPPQPGKASERRELPHLTIFLDTHDGGATWKASMTSMFGRVTRVAFAPDGRGLGLIEFQPDFEFPSEVFSIEWKTGKSARSFRRPDCAVTDIAFDAGGEAYLAGIQCDARSRSRTRPGKLMVLKSSDLASWTEMHVDPGAVARRAVLAVLDGGHAWVATDTGMILRLAAE